MVMQTDCKGLTLVELLITTGIVGMIMLGIVSIDFALRSNERQQSRAGLVAMRTSAAMFDMTTTLAQAQGDVATQCIQIANLAANNTNYICAYTSPTPTDTTDDTWTCYTRETTDLHKCTFTAAGGPNPCSVGANRTSDRVLVTVTSDLFSNSPSTSEDDPPIYTVNRASKTFILKITLKSRYDPTQPSVAGAAYDAVYPQDYLTNPKFIVTSQVMPSGCNP